MTDSEKNPCRYVLLEKMRVGVDKGRRKEREKGEWRGMVRGEMVKRCSIFDSISIFSNNNRVLRKRFLE